jgi:hypothetical protein
MHRLLKLHLNAVVGVTVGGEDVQAPAPRSGKLLRDNPHLTKTQARRRSDQPVLQPDLVAAKLPQLRRLAGVHRQPRPIHGHEHKQ